MQTHKVADATDHTPVHRLTMAWAIIDTAAAADDDTTAPTTTAISYEA